MNTIVDVSVTKIKSGSDDIRKSAQNRVAFVRLLSELLRYFVIASCIDRMVFVAL